MAEGLQIIQVQVEGPVGHGTLPQYFVLELIGRERQNCKYYSVCNSQTQYRPSFVDRWCDEPEGNYIKLPDLELTEEAPRVVMTRSIGHFNALNSASVSAPVYEWTDRDTAVGVELGADDYLILRLRLSGIDTRATNAVAWGTPHETMFNEKDKREIWDTPNTCPSPRAGEALTRVRYGNSHQDWEIDPTPIPSDPGVGREGAWLSFDLPDFVCSLNQSMTPTSPSTGEYFTVEGGEALTSTGTIQIDFEQIGYIMPAVNRLMVFGRGKNGTMPASHQVGSLISIIHEGLATRSPRVGHVTLRRRRVYDDNGALIVPKNFIAYGSIYEDPLRPTEDTDPDSMNDWLRHWEALHSVADNSSVVVRMSMGDARWRHLLLFIKNMSVPSRAIINQIQIHQPNGRGASNAENGLGQVVRDVLESFISPDLISIHPQAFAGTIPDILLSAGSVSDAIESVAALAGSIVVYSCDGGVSIEKSYGHPLQSKPTKTYAVLDYDELREGNVSMSAPSVASMRRHLVEMEDQESGEIFTAGFPPQVEGFETVTHQLKSNIANDSHAALMARFKWSKDQNHLGKYSFETVGPAPWLRVGLKCLIRDTSNSTDIGGELVPVRITGVTHGGENNNEQGQAVRWGE